MSILTFPTLAGLTFPTPRTANTSRLRHRSVSGKSTTQSLQPYPTYSYELIFEFLRSDSANLEWQALQSFYVASTTQSAPFHFLDPDDSAATNEVLGLGDGTTKDFLFVRTLGSLVEPVQDVNATGLVVKVNGVTKTVGVDFTPLTTVQYGTVYGLHFVAAPANGASITATFSYWWLAEFDEDSVQFSKLLFGFYEARSVKITTVLQ